MICQSLSPFLIRLKSIPSISGEFIIHHIVICVLFIMSVILSIPNTSISGSFQPLSSPANSSIMTALLYWEAILAVSFELHLARPGLPIEPTWKVISFKIRQESPTLYPQFCGCVLPHSQIDNTTSWLGSAAFKPSRKAAYELRVFSCLL